MSTPVPGSGAEPVRGHTRAASPGTTSGASGRRRVRLVSVVAGMAVVLALGGVYAWSGYGDDERALLPTDCADLLPADLAERLPGSQRVELRGEVTEAEEEGVLQVAHCEDVGDVEDGPAHFSLQVVLYDPDHQEAVRRMRTMVADGRQARETEDFASEYSDPPMRAVEWRSLSVGDGGYATASQPVGEEPDELWSSLEYSFDNARVSLFHRTDGSVDPAQGLDTLESLATEITERVPGPAEPGT